MDISLQINFIGCYLLNNKSIIAIIHYGLKKLYLAECPNEGNLKLSNKTPFICEFFKKKKQWIRVMNKFIWKVELNAMPRSK